MDYELIDIKEIAGGQVIDLQFGPPPANILSSQMMSEISHELDEIEKKRDVKLIIFSGQGRHFCFGASVEEHTKDKVKDMLPQFHNFIGKVINFPIPTMAKVSGLCLGGGFEFALACNYIFADEMAKFAVPEIQLAVFPPVACVLLPFRCGEVMASKMVLTGDQASAEILYHHGLVNAVSESGQLDDVIQTFYEKQILPHSASSLRIANKACRMTISDHYSRFIGDLEKLYLDTLMETEDANEGINAFLEKRKAEWKNG